MTMGARERSKAYYEKYHSSEKAKKDRAARNKARREAEKKGKVIRPRINGGQEEDEIK
jgi:hypothetical protein